MRYKLSLPRAFRPVVLVCLITIAAHGNGIYRNGTGPRGMSLSGAETPWVQTALGAMSANPAGLRQVDRSLDLGVVGGFPRGEFQNRVDNDGKLENSFEAWPEFATSLPYGKGPLTFGLSVIPQGALRADWTYVDPPGGADGNTSYGRQTHRSEILVLRSAAGAAYEINQYFTAGASIGLIYNHNSLKAPYVFQNQPTLRGAKTLLDLDTDGFGVDGHFGILFRPHTKVQVGLTYQTRTTVHSHGDAAGNASVQLANLGLGGARPDFHYEAEVVNVFPHTVSGGIAWEVLPKFRVMGQIDWLDWGNAFDDLQIHLTEGNNSDLNGLVGSDKLDDSVPLRWENRLVYRAGVEYAFNDAWTLRAGYSYGKSPVPEGTLTPMTAAIMEHTLSAGVGFQTFRYRFDVAYQYDLPNRQTVGTSDLRSGEYSNSSVKVSMHWVGIAAALRF